MSKSSTGTVISCHATQDGTFLARVRIGREIATVSSRFEEHEGAKVKIVGTGALRRIAKLGEG